MITRDTGAKRFHFSASPKSALRAEEQEGARSIACGYFVPTSRTRSSCLSFPPTSLTPLIPPIRRLFRASSLLVTSRCPSRRTNSKHVRPEGVQLLQHHSEDQVQHYWWYQWTASHPRGCELLCSCGREVGS